MLIAFAVVFIQPVGSWIFMVLTLLITGMTVWEIGTVVRGCKLQINRWLALIFAELLMLKYGTGAWGKSHLAFIPDAAAVIMLMVITGMILVLFARDREQQIIKAMATPGAVLLAVTLLLPLADIYFSYGALIFLSLVLATKAADTGGYIAGMLSNKLMKNGNHKIVPSISPKKSWEGTVGAAVFSIAVTALLVKFECIELNCWQIVLWGFLAFLGSFAGDLTESQLKRSAGIKDSGSWIPGMGGILDVLDSFIYNAPLFYAVLKSGVIICQ